MTAGQAAQEAGSLSSSGLLKLLAFFGVGVRRLYQRRGGVLLLVEKLTGVGSGTDVMRPL